MKRLLIILSTFLLSLQIAFVDGYQSFHEAVTLYSQNKFERAKQLFLHCQASGEFDSVNISIWISRCDAGIKDQRQRAQAAERERLAELAQRKQNAFVYISVNGTESGDLFNSTESALSEVMRLNHRSFCLLPEDALTIVTARVNMKPESSSNGFYKATGEGFIRLGSAIDENEFVGQWTVDSEATSAVSMDDAERLLRNKLNHKLGYALDNLLNGRPQSPEYYIPEQSISIFISKSSDVEEENLIIMRDALNGYIARTPGMTVSDALSKDKMDDFDDILKLQAQYVRREGRAPVHELDGFNLTLRLFVKKEPNNDYTFIGEIVEFTGKSLATVTIHGADLGITDLNSYNQKLAAKALAVGLGFSNWEIGEYIGKHKLAYYDGLHGLLVQEYAPLPMGGVWRDYDRTTNPFRNIGEVRNCITSDDRGIISPNEANQWRYPTIDELKMIRDGKNGQGGRRALGLSGTYWSCSSRKKGTHLVLDFITGEEKQSKDNDFRDASWLLVKEF